MLKAGIEHAGNAVNFYQICRNGRAVLNAHHEFMAATDDEDAQEIFDEMMRATGRLMGPEVEAFMLFAEHGTALIADSIIYAQKCLGNYLKGRCR